MAFHRLPADALLCHSMFGEFFSMLSKTYQWFIEVYKEYHDRDSVWISGARSVLDSLGTYTGPQSKFLFKQGGVYAWNFLYEENEE